MGKWQLTLSFLLMSVFSMAQSDSLSINGKQYRKDYTSIAIMGGIHDSFDSKYTMEVYGFSISRAHFYGDLTFGFSSKRFASKKKIYPGVKENWNVHLGYRFLCGHFGISPVLGLSVSDIGVMYGKDLVEDFSLFNKLYPTNEWCSLDYGIMCDYRYPYDYGGNIIFGVTRRNIMFGVGICF